MTQDTNNEGYKRLYCKVYDNIKINQINLLEYKK